MGNGESTGGGNDWSNTNDNDWSSRRNTNSDDWSSWRNTNGNDWSSWRNADNDGGAFLRQLFENRDLPSSSTDDLRNRYSDLPSSSTDDLRNRYSDLPSSSIDDLRARYNDLPPSFDDFSDRYRGRPSSPTPPPSPRRHSLSPPSSPGRYANRGRSETPPPFSDWHPDRDTPPLSRTSSRRNSWSPPPFSRYIDVDRSSDPAEETRSSPARNSNLIGMGINPHRWLDQQANTSGPANFEMEQLSEERQVKEVELKSWIDAGRWPVFENTRAENLSAELDTAEMLGIKPLHVDDPGFGQIASEGPIKWVVTENGELLVSPSIVAHSVLTNGEGVMAAGEAIIAVDANERTCLEINTNSDHYQPDDRSLEVGRQAFAQFGIQFAEEERLHDIGHDERNSGIGDSDAVVQEEPRVFENMRPEDLTAELETAEMLGIRPMRVDDPDFEHMANEHEGQIIWVVLESGQLLTAPDLVAHTVLSAGEAVIAAGSAVVAINGNERFCIEITTNSNNYLADDQSLEIGKQAFAASGIPLVEEAIPYYSGYDGENSRNGDLNAVTQEETRVFANTHPEDLAAELETAEMLGISPIHVDDPDFRQLANVGPMKWVVTQSGELLVASSIVAHTVLTNGEAVIAAGEAEIGINGHQRGLEININSDHYQADERSLEIGRRAFEAFGIEFPLAAGRDGSGDGGTAVAVQPEMSIHAPLSPQREGADQQASTSGTSHLEVVQEPETREVADGEYGRQGDGNGGGNSSDGGGNGGDDRSERGDEESSSSSDEEGDGYGRVDANRIREVTREMWQMLASRRRAEGEGTSQGGGAQVEYVQGESSGAQLPEVGARQSDAEPEVGGNGRYLIRNLEDLERLKTIERTKDNPPADVLPEDKQLWDEYVDYWHERIKKFEKEFNKKLERESSTVSPDGLSQEFKEKLKLKSSTKPKKPTEPPRDWESYKEVLTNPNDRRRQGNEFNKDAFKVINPKRTDAFTETEVHFSKGGWENQVAPDIVAVDKHELADWGEAVHGQKLDELEKKMEKKKFSEAVEAVNKQQSAEAAETDGQTKPAPPKIETYSNKSRDFEKMLKGGGENAVIDQVKKDVKELLDKYSGKVEIRIDKPSKLKVMRGLTVEVKKMYLVYNDRPDLITSPTREFIVDVVKDAAKGKPVEVQFIK